MDLRNQEFEEDGWKEIERSLDEIERFSKTGLSSRDFHTKLLAHMISALEAVGGAIWKQNDTGRLEIECTVNSENAFITFSIDRETHGRELVDAFHTGEARIVIPDFSHNFNQVPYIRLLCPIRIGTERILVVELIKRSNGDAQQATSHLRALMSACESAEDFHKNQQLSELQERELWLHRLLQYGAKLRGNLDLDRLCYAMANESRVLVDCDRVSVLVDRSSRPTVMAVSGIDDFDRRSNAIRELENAVQAVSKWNEPLWYPDDTRNLPADVVASLEKYLDESHARSLGIIPLQEARDNQLEAIGMLVVERLHESDDEEWRHHVTAVAQQSAAGLANALEFERIPLRRFSQSLHKIGWLTKREHTSKLVAGLGLALVCAAILTFVPIDFNVQSRGELQPQERHYVFAPIDGVVENLHVQHGSKVRQLDMLVTLNSPQLELEYSEVSGKRRTLEEELRANEAEILKNVDSSSDNRNRFGLSARIEQIKVSLKGLEQQCKILDDQRAGMKVLSPADGVVLTWDLDRLLTSRPVKRGDQMMVVAPLQAKWDLELKIPDDQVGHVLAARSESSQSALDVFFVLAGEPSVEYHGKIREIAGTADVDEAGVPVVRVTVAVTESKNVPFRPGAAAVAKIRCGRRSIGYVWFHEVWEFIQLQLFF